MASFWESIKVDGADMRLYTSVPEGTGPFPTVVVIQHQGGVDDFVQEMTQRLASAVYAAVAPELYHREGPAPVDRTSEIHCPLLGLFGEEDANPSPADMRKLDAELTKHGKVHEFYSYPGAGHAFMNRRGERYRADADGDSWPKTLAFFA